MKKAKLGWGFGLFILLAVFSFNACGDEEPTVLDRDKFIGEYLGDFNCPGLLAIISSDSVSFSIDVGVDPNATESVIVFLPIEGQPAPLSITATVSGNTITFADTKEDIPIPQFGGLLTDINVSGEGTISGDNLSGDMTLVITEAASGGLLGSESCTITGVRQ